MPKFEGVKDLLNEHHELAALVLFLTSVVLLVIDKIGELTFAGLILMTLVTYLGTKYFAGLKVGKDGFEVNDE